MKHADKNKPFPSKPLSARAVALSVLIQVIHKHTPLDQTLEQALLDHHLDSRDRAFTRNLVFLVMRRLGALKHVLGQIVNKPIANEAARTKTAVLMGIAQVLFLRTSDHAAVSESVDLIGNAPHPKERGMKGLVNALLRRVVRERDHWLAEIDSRPEADIAGPFRRRYSDAFGADEAKSLGMTLRAEPPLDITLKPGEDITAWAEKLEAKPIGNHTLRREFTDVTALDGFEGGHWWVQDIAATLPAQLLPSDVSGKTVLDMCAAPGGKTMQLAAMGANVIALDRSRKRLDRLQQNLDRTHLTAEVVTADGTNFKPETKIDHILLDAPCSATGTFRRNPDVLWSRSKADIDKLAALQAKLLDHAFTLLPAGGVMIYCVCSLESEEGVDQVSAFLSRTDAASRLPISSESVGSLPVMITDDGDVLTRPTMMADQGGMDGFTISRLTRTA